MNVLYGSAGGLQATAPDDQFWNQDSPSVLDMAEPGDQFGHSVRSGDYNGDGFADLSIGARFEALTDLGEGAVNVLYGSASGVQAASPNDQFWNQDSPGVLDTAEVSDGFGSSLGGGDFNNDGSDDLAIGVVGESVAGASNSGAVRAVRFPRELQTTSPTISSGTRTAQESRTPPKARTPSERWTSSATSSAERSEVASNPAP